MRSMFEESLLSFPVLDKERWQWPMPPLAWQHLPPDDTSPQPCEIETPSGTRVHGELLAIDPPSASITLRISDGGSSVSLPFARFRRLTLTQALLPAPRSLGAPVERVPAAAQERDYRLLPARSSEALTGRCAGHVDTPEGLFLFTPVDDERSLLRVFVPRSAYSRAEYGLSAQELAARHWIATPQALLGAIERQPHAPVVLMGRALTDLGMVTPVQLERALAHRLEDQPLGEMLVAEGLLSRSNLQTALAYKMGYPLVDLARFPIDRAAARKLPLRMALEVRAVPLMVDGTRLIVAVDQPSRADRLKALSVFGAMTIVPVLAAKDAILLALTDLSQQRTWSGPASAHLSFLVSTY
jgi:hypothetical protein